MVMKWSNAGKKGSKAILLSALAAAALLAGFFYYSISVLHCTALPCFRVEPEMHDGQVRFSVGDLLLSVPREYLVSASLCNADSPPSCMGATLRAKYPGAISYTSDKEARDAFQSGQDLWMVLQSVNILRQRFDAAVGLTQGELVPSEQRISPKSAVGQRFFFVRPTSSPQIAELTLADPASGLTEIWFVERDSADRFLHPIMRCLWLSDSGAPKTCELAVELLGRAYVLVSFDYRYRAEWRAIAKNVEARVTKFIVNQNAD